MSALLCCNGFSKDFTQIVMYSGIGGDCRTDIDSNRCCVYEFHPGNSIRMNCTDMFRQFLIANFASSAGIRLSKIIVVLPEPETPVTAVSRPLGNNDLQRLNSVDRVGGECNCPFCEKALLLQPVF